MVCVWEGVGDRTELKYFDPNSYGRQRWVFLVLQRPTLLSDGFLYCILSATSLDPDLSEPQGPFGLMWLSLPHLVYNSVRSLTATLTSVLAELYDSLTFTQSPTRSLKSHVGSSSSGNNCHAGPRSPFHQPISAYAISSHNCQNVSLPSGASPWNGIFGRVKRSKYNTNRTPLPRYA